MSQISIIGLLTLTAVIPYLLSLTNISIFLPQLIALLSLLFFIFNKYKLPVIYLVSLIVNLIIFSTNGVQSPLFFLIYFLLFVTAFQFPPSTSLSLSLVIFLLLSQTLNSYSSLLALLSLLFITPIVALISLQTQKQNKIISTVAVEETDLLLWLNLKFKTGIGAIIDSSSQLLSTPITPIQKDHLKNIKNSAKSLLHSADKLTNEIGQPSDEI